MNELEPSLVITRVGNGFIVRGLNGVMADADLESDSRVFNDFEEMFEFIDKHFKNLDEMKISKLLTTTGAQHVPSGEDSGNGAGELS